MLNKLHQVLLSFLFNTSRAIQKVQVSLLACRYAYGFRITSVLPVFYFIVQDNKLTAPPVGRRQLNTHT